MLLSVRAFSSTLLLKYAWWLDRWLDESRWCAQPPQISTLSERAYDFEPRTLHHLQHQSFQRLWLFYCFELIHPLHQKRAHLEHKSQKIIKITLQKQQMKKHDLINKTRAFVSVSTTLGWLPFFQFVSDVLNIVWGATLYPFAIEITPTDNKRNNS